MWRKVRNGLLKALVLLITFIVSFAGISFVANRGNAKVIASMGAATLPMVYVQSSLGDMNGMHGYVSQMQGQYMRDSLTPLQEDRKLSIAVDTCGQTVKTIGYEVRSLDTKRLVEDTQIDGYETVNGRIETLLPIKNLLDKDTEYILIINLSTDKRDKISYFTRILLPSTDYHTEQKLEFVKWFHDTTFSKERADELKKYLEQKKQDDSSFRKVTIQSSLEQVTWGDMNVRQETAPVMKILEIDGSTAAIKCDFMVSVTEDTTEYYQVSEYFRIRYTASRTYLLDYEREMEVVFNASHANYEEDMIKLGITNQDKTVVYSSNCEKIVFEQSGMLWQYDSKADKMIQVYGFRDDNPLDIRANYNQNAIKIMNLDDNGDMQFMVYGYMNRGEHEGECGIGVYYFDANKNCVTEKIFIQSAKPYEFLKLDVEKLAYISPVKEEVQPETTSEDAEEEKTCIQKENELYVLLNQNVYKINLDSRKVECIVSNLREDSYVVAENMKHIAWQEEMKPYQSKTVCIYNIDTGECTSAKAGNGEYIYPMGFMDDDFIYGVARGEDVSYDVVGAAFFPMHKLYIQDENGIVVKEYERKNLFITEVLLNHNVLQLKRVAKQENGEYKPADDDNITNNKEEKTEKVTIVTVTSGTKKQEVYMKLPDKLPSSQPQLLTPKEVVSDGDKRVVLEGKEDLKEEYFAYGKGSLQGVYTNASKAVLAASETAGTALDGEFHYLWKRNGRKITTQISEIAGSGIADGKTSLGVCLTQMLKYEGVNKDGDVLLQQGKTPLEILSANIKGTVVNLTGCSVDTVLYYVNAGKPVLAVTGENKGVLIVGYDNLNIVLMNPQGHKLIAKMGMNDSIKYFENHGNYFISYTN